MKRKLVFNALLFLLILVITMPTLAVQPTTPPSAETPPQVNPDKVMTLGLSPQQVVLELEGQHKLDAMPASGRTAAVQAVQADVDLILDDGSAEDTIGVSPTTEFIYLNRFTPSPCDFSLDLDEVHVYFESGEVNVGDDFILAIYENTSGSFDPAVGSNWLASFPVTVQALDAWNVYTLSPAVHFDGPGDVLIGVISLEAEATSYHPAALDTNSGSHRRSWAGWWATSPPPDLPDLPPGDNWLLIDDAGFAGNWLIRGYASRGPQVPAVVLQPDFQKSAGDFNTTVQYDLTLVNCSGQQDTFDMTYTGNWLASGPATVGPVANDSSRDFQIQVTIPADAGCAECDPLEVGAQAQANPVISDTAAIETCAAKLWQTESVLQAQAVYWAASTCTDAYGASGTCFYVGGLDASGVTGRARRYDIASRRWFPMPSAPTPVFGATLGYINGKLYLAGGYTTTSGDWGGTYKLQIYNLTTNRWTTGPDMPAWGPVTGAGGSNGAVVSDKLHVVGGCGANNCQSNQHAVYNPASNTWTHLAPVPYYPVFFGATSGGGKLYVAGEYWSGNQFFSYDPATDSWQELAPLPGGAGKKDPVMAYAPDCGGVFLYGGDKGSWGDVQDTTWVYHPAANAWSNYPATLNRASTAAGGGFANGRLWNFGGSGGAGALTPPPHESLDYCCPLPPPVGAVEGLVKDANTGQPIENAHLLLEGITDPDFYNETWTDDRGYYSFDYLLVADYKLEAAGFGYYRQTTNFTIEGGVTKGVEFLLDAAVPELSHNAVGVSLPAGNTGSFTAELHNHGTGDLHFHISELPADSVFPIPSLASSLSGSSRVDPQVYADLEASPDGTTKFIVYMAEQADLTEAFAIKDRSARGWYVFNTLRTLAERSQAGLRAELDRAGVSYESRYVVNALIVKGALDTVNSISARPEVAFVGADVLIPIPEPVKTQSAIQEVEGVEWNIDRVRANDVWADPNFGTEGQGIVVSNIDTGVEHTHAALVNQYRGNLGGSFDHNYNWWDATGDSPTVPKDTYGHGTHTMGTMVGDDGGANQIGMAPGAQWITCRASTGRSITSDDLLECADFILAPCDLTGANCDPDARPDIVNNSWGGGQAQWWYNQAIYAWRAAGIFPSFSIGNEGPDCDTAGDPGDQVNVIGVGATDKNDSNAPGSPADFSSRGPAKVTDLIKPNVSAPGAEVRSSVPGGGYDAYGGTSMASPHVAGAAALIWAAQPDLRGNVQITYWIIEQTTDPLLVDQGYYCGADTAASVPNNQYGWGRLDAYEAVNLAFNNEWDVDWLVVDPVQGVVLPASSQEIDLNFDATGLATGECYNAYLKFEFNDPYVVETFVPVALCVDTCLGLDDITISGPDRLFVDREGIYSVAWEPVTATLPITIEWNNGTTGTVTTYSWGAAGIQTIVVTATHCGGAVVVNDSIQVEVVESAGTIYLPLIFKTYYWMD